MASPLLVAACTAFLLYQIYRYLFDRPQNFPPGPPRLPIFGSYPFLLLVNFKHMHRATATLSRWYGSPILGFHYQQTPTIAVHDWATAKEVLDNPDLDGRPVSEQIRARDPQFAVWGIFFRDGAAWKEQRRFTLRHLRDFGFGRRFAELETHINEEVLGFVDLVRNGPKYEWEKELVSDGVVQLPIAFSAQPANVLLRCLLNEGYDRGELQCLFRAGRSAFRFQRNGCMYGRLFSFLPSLRWMAPGFAGYTPVRESSMELHAFVQELVDRQFRTFDAAHERHFLDLYFREMLRAEGEESAFQTLATISFCLQRLVMNPDVMRRVQRQLDEVVGRGRLPQLDDRPHLPQLEAILRESMRLDTLLANNVPHVAQRDTTVGGYDLPKGGLVLVVLQSVHTDELVFPDALSFRPQRFLGADGQLRLQLDKSLPFGAGRRLCAGETFARNLLFLFVGAILQNFELSLPEGETGLDPAAERPVTGVNKIPADFRLKFGSR